MTTAPLPTYGKVNIPLTDARAYTRSASDSSHAIRVRRTVTYGIFTKTTRPTPDGPYTPAEVRIDLWRWHRGNRWHLSERQTSLGGWRPVPGGPGKFRHEWELLSKNLSPPPAWVGELVAVEMRQP